jgi:recombinational DNA repair ATPase RecF
VLDLQIKNFKSIDELELQLGRVNLFIGENGCGKTSILEAVGMAAAGRRRRSEILVDF